MCLAHLRENIHILYRGCYCLQSRKCWFVTGLAFSTGEQLLVPREEAGVHWRGSHRDSMRKPRMLPAHSPWCAGQGSSYNNGNVQFQTPTKHVKRTLCYLEGQNREKGVRALAGAVVQGREARSCIALKC